MIYKNNYPLVAAILFSLCSPVTAQTNLDLDEPEDPFTKLVLIERLSYANCAQQVQQSISKAELNSMLAKMKNDSSVTLPDYSGVEQCISRGVDHVGRLAKQARAAAGKSRSTSQAIDRLERTHGELMLALTPSGDETKSSYAERLREAKIKLKAAGDDVIMQSCNRNMDCSISRSKQIRGIERTGVI